MQGCLTISDGSFAHRPQPWYGLSDTEHCNKKGEYSMVVTMISSTYTVFVEPASLARSDLSSPGSRLSQLNAIGAKSVLLRAKSQIRFYS